MKPNKEDAPKNEAQAVKCVMVVDDGLPLGILANTAAILGATLGKQVPQAVGEDVCDAAGRKHLGIVNLPVPILKADQEKIRCLREKLYEPDYEGLLAADFSDVAQTCNVYEEYIQKSAQTSISQYTYYGLLLYGDKKKVNQLTGSMPLLR